MIIIGKDLTTGNPILGADGKPAAAVKALELPPVPAGYKAEGMLLVRSTEIHVAHREAPPECKFAVILVR